MDILTAALISILVVWLYSFIGETMALTDSLFAAVTELQASVAAVSARVDKLVVDLANAVTPAGCSCCRPTPSRPRP
jgi:hypothetical protein